MTKLPPPPKAVKSAVKSKTTKKKDPKDFKKVDLVGDSCTKEGTRPAEQTPAYKALKDIKRLPEEVSALALYTELAKVRKELEDIQKDLRYEANLEFQELGKGGAYNGCTLKKQVKRTVWQYSVEVTDLAEELKKKQAVEQSDGTAIATIPKSDLHKDAVFSVSVPKKK
jgi:hypothetical protein